jgi:MoaA/NifB/PqqE/SkfB family radical SAM enzyme
VIPQLSDPVLPVADLALRTRSSTDDVLAAYRAIRGDEEIAAFVCSLFYSHRLLWAAAAATTSDWMADPERPARLLAGEPVMSRTVELHASKGTCGYRCTMCLWSDQDQLTYRSRDLRADGLLPIGRWCQVLDELRAEGVATIVLSGGGEVLLNPDVPELLAHARQLGLRVHLYTTGFHMPAKRIGLWSELARVERVRFSIHSPNEATYNMITGLSGRHRALERVTDNIRRLLDQRCTGLRVGIGFVAQPANLTEIRDMADFAAHLGVDFLDLRKDEVDVTAALTDEQLDDLRSQLRVVRATAAAGGYGPMAVDMGDELVAITNRERLTHQRTPECRAKYFRPTISPYGIVAPCDLTAEPRFAAGGFNLGNIGRRALADVVADLAHHRIPDACAQCMPSSRTGNAMFHKLLTDLRNGIKLADQPYVFEQRPPVSAGRVRSCAGRAHPEE